MKQFVVTLSLVGICNDPRCGLLAVTSRIRVRPHLLIWTCGQLRVGPLIEG
jgi:hypothetical protein